MNFKINEFGEIFIVVAFLIAQLAIVESSESLWAEFKTKYGKNYRSSVDESAKKQTFLRNLQRIAASNADLSIGYQIGMNQFADQTLEEFLSTHTGLVSQSSLNFNVRDPPNGFNKRSAVVSATYPTSLTYQNTGAVSAVKDQASCGACWAFTASEAIEAQTFRVLGKMISPSEQQLVDCATTNVWANNGCNGGNQVKAFVYMSSGIMNETSYPYTSSQGSCKADSSKYMVATNAFQYNSDKSDWMGYYTDSTRTMINFFSYFSVVDSGIGDMNSTMVNTLAQVLNQVGPVAIEVCAYDGFQSYTSGIYYNSTGCSDAAINHAVLLVGYDFSSSDPTQQYWIIKNQWNTNWGMSGYMRMRFGAGLFRNPSYPVINTSAFAASTTSTTTTTTSKPTSSTKAATSSASRLESSSLSTCWLIVFVSLIYAILNL